MRAQHGFLRKSKGVKVVGGDEGQDSLDVDINKLFGDGLRG